jgi:hypothetical protein
VRGPGSLLRLELSDSGKEPKARNRHGSRLGCRRPERTSGAERPVRPVRGERIRQKFWHAVARVIPQFGGMPPRGD